MIGGDPDIHLIRNSGGSEGTLTRGRKLDRSASFLERARSVLRKKPSIRVASRAADSSEETVKRKPSFLRSKPVQRLSKLTRRATFTTSSKTVSSWEYHDPSRAWTWKPKPETEMSVPLSNLSHVPSEVGSQYIPNISEDLPVDFFEGAMNIHVLLPGEKDTVTMSVERRTPMLDVMIRIGTEHGLSPGGHVLQVLNSRNNDYVYYKPSTPIGAIDASTIHVVPKNSINESGIRKTPTKSPSRPFELTFRLQVKLPRNQLSVMRVSHDTTVIEVLNEICKEKNMDPLKYTIKRNAEDNDDYLDPLSRLSDCRLREVVICPKGNSYVNCRSVSTTDILKYQELESSRKLFSRTKTRSSAGDSSISSGSSHSPSRSLSPVNMSSHDPPAPPTRNKKRRAPAPPKARNGTSEIYRNDLSLKNSSTPTKSVSMSNLSSFPGDLSRIDRSKHSSTTSINSLGLKKRRAPPPPIRKLPEAPILEEETRSEAEEKSETHNSSSQSDTKAEVTSQSKGRLKDFLDSEDEMNLNAYEETHISSDPSLRLKDANETTETINDSTYRLGKPTPPTRSSSIPSPAPRYSRSPTRSSKDELIVEKTFNQNVGTQHLSEEFENKNKITTRDSTAGSHFPKQYCEEYDSDTSPTRMIDEEFNKALENEEIDSTDLSANHQPLQSCELMSSPLDNTDPKPHVVLETGRSPSLSTQSQIIADEYSHVVPKDRNISAIGSHSSHSFDRTVSPDSALACSDSPASSRRSKSPKELTLPGLVGDGCTLSSALYSCSPDLSQSSGSKHPGVSNQPDLKLTHNFSRPQSLEDCGHPPSKPPRAAASTSSIPEIAFDQRDPISRRYTLSSFPTFKPQYFGASAASPPAYKPPPIPSTPPASNTPLTLRDKLLKLSKIPSSYSERDPDVSSTSGLVKELFNKDHEIQEEVLRFSSEEDDDEERDFNNSANEEDEEIKLTHSHSFSSFYAGNDAFIQSNDSKCESEINQVEAFANINDATTPRLSSPLEIKDNLPSERCVSETLDGFDGEIDNRSSENWVIPEPPSGFGDDSVVEILHPRYLEREYTPDSGNEHPDELTEEDTMIPQTKQISPTEPIPKLHGKMQFSIDSYDSRAAKEAPYNQKLGRSESMTLPKGSTITKPIFDNETEGNHNKFSTLQFPLNNKSSHEIMGISTSPLLQREKSPVSPTNEDFISNKDVEHSDNANTKSRSVFNMNGIDSMADDGEDVYENNKNRTPPKLLPKPIISKDVILDVPKSSNDNVTSYERVSSPSNHVKTLSLIYDSAKGSDEEHCNRIPSSCSREDEESSCSESVLSTGSSGVDIKMRRDRVVAPVPRPSIQLSTWDDRRSSSNERREEGSNDFRIPSSHPQRKSVQNIFINHNNNEYNSSRTNDDRRAQDVPSPQVKEYVSRMESYKMDIERCEKFKMENNNYRNNRRNEMPDMRRRYDSESPPIPPSPVYNGSRRSPSEVVSMKSSSSASSTSSSPRSMVKEKLSHRDSIGSSHSGMSSPSPKSQFYFGESVNLPPKPTIKPKQTAIDKVKKNEILSHPMPKEQNISYKIREKTDKKSNIITIENSTPKNYGPPRVIGIGSKNIQPEKSQEETRKAFEAELLAGKSRLKSQSQPKAPVSYTGRVLEYRHEDVSPKLTNFPAKLNHHHYRQQKPVAPTAREALMEAIKSTGGTQGLRKVKRELRPALHF